jgi:hypothetical protein
MGLLSLPNLHIDMNVLTTEYGPRQSVVPNDVLDMPSV